MRVHITLGDDLVHDLDRRVSARRRSTLIAETVLQALDEQRRWKPLESASGSITGAGHPWDKDPAAWVRRARADVARIG